MKIVFVLLLQFHEQTSTTVSQKLQKLDERRQKGGGGPWW